MLHSQEWIREVENGPLLTLNILAVVAEQFGKSYLVKQQHKLGVSVLFV